MRFVPAFVFAASWLACAAASAQVSINLADYSLVGLYVLPEPTRVTAPTSSLLAQEASAVT